MQIAAWLDDELEPEAAIAVEEALRRDPEARAYADQLRSLRSDLARAVPASSTAAAWGEFRRRQLDAEKGIVPMLGIPRLLTISAAILIFGMGSWLALRNFSISQSGGDVRADEWAASDPASAVQLLETDIEGASPVVYIDEPSGWTVVWVMVPEAADASNAS